MSNFLVENGGIILGALAVAIAALVSGMDQPRE